MKKWNLTDLQAESILNLRLRFLRRLEEKIIINEKNELEVEIKELKELIENKDKQLRKIDNETKEVEKVSKTSSLNKPELVKTSPTKIKDLKKDTSNPDENDLQIGEEDGEDAWKGWDEG